MLDSFQLPPSCTKISFSLNTKEQGVEKEQEQRVDEGQEVEWKEPVLRRLRFVSGDDPHSGVRQVGPRGTWSNNAFWVFQFPGRCCLHSL